MGRPLKTALDKARVRVWFLEVAGCENLSAYKLDEKFLWKNLEGKPEAAKVFERILREGSETMGNDKWRSFPELVDHIDEQPGYEGTANIYKARIWDLLELETISKLQIVERIDQALAENGLERRPPSDIPGFIPMGGVNVFSPSFNEVFMQLINSLHPLKAAYLELLYCFLKKSMHLAGLTSLQNPSLKSEHLKTYFSKLLDEWSKEEPYEDFIKRMGQIEIDESAGTESSIETLAWPICRIGEPPPVVDPTKLPMGITVTGLKST